MLSVYNRGWTTSNTIAMLLARENYKNELWLMGYMTKKGLM